MSTITPVVLAEGQLGNTKATLYTATTTVLVKFGHVHNQGSASETVIIYVKAGATSRIIGRCVIAQHESADFIDKDEALTLESGDLIEGETTNASAVDYVITGATVV
jgi:hypothetical protein